MTAATPVRIGVLGAGRIGRMHAELLARQVGGAEVRAIFDPSPGTAREVAGSLGLATRDAVDEVLGAADVDAVAICSSTPTHADLIVAAAHAGKAIFCEKPVSLDLAEVDRALAAVETAGVPFQIGFNRRFDPAHAAVATAVADGTVGEPHLVRISSRDPAPPPVSYLRDSGGMFLDMTIHDFDMARYVTGSEVVEVYARGAVRVDPEFGAIGDVDTAVVTLAHASGCLTTIDNCRQAVYGFDQRVEVLGSTTAASENPLAHTGVVRTRAGTHAPALPYFYLERYVPSYVREWEACVHAVSTGETPARDRVGRAGAALVIGLAALRSLREWRPVRLEEVDAA